MPTSPQNELRNSPASLPSAANGTPKWPRLLSFCVSTLALTVVVDVRSASTMP
ncbi:hypothetical protein D3C71_2177040 [compost metagenome]